MLEGLDEVRWGSLTHAYGAATDVPEILRALAAGDDDAIGELYGNIWHQGTVYEATAYAVPFLIELLDVERVDAAPLFGLLSAIAGGSSYEEVHRDLWPRSERESEASQEKVDRELAWVRAARDAVIAGVPTYLRHLAEGRAERVRAAAAYTLGACTTAHAQIVPALHARIASDESELARASAIFAAAELGGASAEAIARWLDDADPLPRLAAALAAARADGELPERIVRVLTEDAPRCVRQLERLDWSAAHGEPLDFVVEHLGARPELEVTLLSCWMRHRNVGARRGAVYAAERTMHTWRSAPARLVPELARCLSDRDADVRYWAASHLAGAGRAASAAADALWEVLEREPLARNQPSSFALKALSKLRDPRAAAYAAARLEAIAPPAEKRPRSRREPVAIPDGLGASLRLLGGWAEPCFAPLVRLIPVAPAGNDRIAVIETVGAFGDRAAIAVPAIRAELGEHTRVATRVLGDLGPLAADAITEVRALLRHEDPIVRVNAARAVWRIAGQAGVVLPVLRKAVRSGPDRGGRSFAMEVIAEMGPAAASLAPLLPPFFGVDDEWSAVGAAIAYWHVTGESERVIPTLLEHIVAAPLGRQAVRCLAAIGPAAAAAIPQLREEVSSRERRSRLGTDEHVDDDELWVELCALALRRIGG